MAILSINLHFKLLDQFLFVGDDLGACSLLCLDVLFKINKIVLIFMRFIRKSQVRGNGSIFSLKANGSLLTSASSLQSSFSSSSCQFQSISTFFLCDWMTSFWILFALSFLFLSSSVRRFLSNSSVSVLILTIRSSVFRRTYSRMPIKVCKIVSVRTSCWRKSFESNLPLASSILSSPYAGIFTRSWTSFLSLIIVCVKRL